MVMLIKGMKVILAQNGRYPFSQNVKTVLR